MQNYITSANLNVLNGILLGKMEFESGLNIISGENGTLKTQLLQALRTGAAVASQPSSPLRMQSISPKRNSERRATEAILQYFRQSNKTWETNINERASSQINLSGFDNYPSVGELYYLIFEHRCKDGKDRHVHMTTVVAEFNAVINSVFPKYTLLANWDETLGAPKIRMAKNAVVEFPIEALSMGEQEVLSLILSVSTNRDNIDVYLIDEPEVHLNWHLEELLFSFLDDICEKFHKQVIVVTHSRTIFKPRFLPKAQFLTWGDDSKVSWGRDLTKQQRSRLAGDAIEIVALGDFSKTTIFVEDRVHAEVVSALAETYAVEIITSQCGNSINVKSIYRYQLANGVWTNAYFMVDGDNQGNQFPDDPRFIHLPYYCIENIFLDPEILCIVSSKTIQEVKEVMVEACKRKKSTIFQKNKFFEFLADSLAAEHMTFERLKTFDASVILDDVIDSLQLVSFSNMLPRYLSAAKTKGILDSLVGQNLFAAIQSAAKAIAVTSQDSAEADAH